MIPGEIKAAAGEIELNPGRETRNLEVSFLFNHINTRFTVPTATD